MSGSPRYAILGNAGSGKSTLAMRLAQTHGLAHLDLDLLAWLPDVPPARDPAGGGRVAAWCAETPAPGWVVEGCYEDLVTATFPWRPHLIWLDPGEAACLAHCRQRPFEAHKHSNPAEQEARLAFLLTWVSDHYQNSGPMSRLAHQTCFEAYDGPKSHLRTPAEASAFAG
jgi:adenylate kinase family enzyme